MAAVTGVANESYYLELATVLRVDQDQPDQRGKGQSWLVLVGTLAAFVLVGLIAWSLEQIIILVLVLFFHECGHLVGMRLFRYQNVRMFFIPLFGAAVSGLPNRRDHSPSKEAIVSMLGPAPGILLGWIVAVVYIAVGHPLLKDAADMLLFLNALNLLPILPLDGGRFFQSVLTRRNPSVEYLFILSGLGGLFLLALIFQSFLILILAFPLLGTFGLRRRINRVVARVREARKSPAYYATTLDAEILQAIHHEMPTLFGETPEESNRSMLVHHLREVRLIIEGSHPSTGATVALLAGYGAFLLMGALGALGLLPMRMHDVVEQGTLSQPERVTSYVADGMPLMSFELNEEGLYHGDVIHYQTPTDRIAIRGEAVNGRRDGIWEYYDPTGSVIARELYEQDRLIHREESQADGTWNRLTPEALGTFQRMENAERLASPPRRYERPDFFPVELPRDKEPERETRLDEII